MKPTMDNKKGRFPKKWTFHVLQWLVWFKLAWNQIAIQTCCVSPEAQLTQSAFVGFQRRKGRFNMGAIQGV
jgi:hypothetical protein